MKLADTADAIISLSLTIKSVNQFKLKHMHVNAAKERHVALNFHVFYASSNGSRERPPAELNKAVKSLKFCKCDVWSAFHVFV